MNWLRHWKVVLALLALFIIGGVTGTAVTLKVVKRVVESRTNPERVPQRMLLEYQDRLGLTPEQIGRIQPLLQSSGREIAELRAEMSGRTFHIIRRSHEQIAAELTPEQQQKFEKLKQELRDRYRQQGPPPGKGMFPIGPGLRPPPPGQRPFEPNSLKEAK